MNKETLDLLQQLAAKLGTTAEHLWSVLIRQAYISFAMDLVLYVALILAMFVCFKKVFPFFGHKCQEDPDGDFVYLLGTFFVGAILLACTLVAIFGISDTVTKIANPEYWALMQIFDAMKGVK